MNPTILNSEELIQSYTWTTSLETDDPYDVWKTALGFKVKHLYNNNQLLGLLPAAGLTVFDTYVNNSARMFYQKQEYPIVRALAAQTLLNLYQKQPSETTLGWVKCHLDWLIENRCNGYNGYGWGLGFEYAVDANFSYSRNTPFSTMTPYMLEAFVLYENITEEGRYRDAILAIYRFFSEDIQVLDSGDDWIATSYTPMKDRIVINANSYALLAHVLCMPFLDQPQQQQAADRARKLYRFVQQQQQEDGSWMYALKDNSFIDCFHSCIVVKNLHKASQELVLPGAEECVSSGWQYIKHAMFDGNAGLFRRFSVKNKPGLVKFDLYDNAEAMNLATLLGEQQFARQLNQQIRATFMTEKGIYSQIEALGSKRNLNFLRWAVMPYLYALSCGISQTSPTNA